LLALIVLLVDLRLEILLGRAEGSGYHRGRVVAQRLLAASNSPSSQASYSF
jgi:hypothetical protein